MQSLHDRSAAENTEPSSHRPPIAWIFLRSSGRAMSVLWLLLAVGFAGGCGESRPATYPARGIVKFSDGKPVKLGTVELLSDDHKINATGTIQQDGTFVLGTFSADDGAVAGSHRVIVTQLIINDGLTQHVHDHGWPVDPHYSSYSTSPLNVTISSEGANELTLTVEKARARQVP